MRLHKGPIRFSYSFRTEGIVIPRVTADQFRYAGIIHFCMPAVAEMRKIAKACAASGVVHCPDSARRLLRQAQVLAHHRARKTRLVAVGRWNPISKARQRAVVAQCPVLPGCIGDDLICPLKVQPQAVWPASAFPPQRSSKCPSDMLLQIFTPIPLPCSPA